MSESLLSSVWGLGLASWRRFVQLLGVVWADRTLRSVFIGLLLMDLAWILWYGVAIGLDEAEITDRWKELDQFHITEEGGYPEHYNYAKTLVLVLLLGHLAMLTRQWVYIAFTIVYTAILMDDFLTIHETMGTFLIETFEIMHIFGLRRQASEEVLAWPLMGMGTLRVSLQAIGEVITWILMGTLLVPLMIYGFTRSDWSHVRNGLALLWPFGMLLFCAIVVDQLYINFYNLFLGAGILIDMAEDGGEMVAITLAFGLAVALVKHGPGD